MIESPLSSLQAWAETFARSEIPILPNSATELALLQAIEDERGTVDAHTLSAAINNDPLMTLKVLTHISRYCTRLSVDPPETLVSAIVMQGINPFFKAFAQAPTVNDWLGGNADALAGLHKVITRSRRAAHFAMGFALRRQDQDAVVIEEAALLHDFAEMLLWCHAPTLALRISRALEADHTLRSADVQMEVLGIKLDDLAQTLMHRWQLPDLLIKTTDSKQAHLAKVRSVLLAVQIARHTQHGWDDPHAQAALPDDAAAVAQLLTISTAVAKRLIIAMDS